MATLFALERTIAQRRAEMGAATDAGAWAVRVGVWEWVGGGGVRMCDRL
jgi:hypothetical protein